MSFARQYVTYPNPYNVEMLHKHMQDLHSIFTNAGFLQTGDSGQYNIEELPDINYDTYLNTTSYNSYKELGRFVFDFPDYYDDDGCDLKLKFILIVYMVKVTAYSSATIGDVALNIAYTSNITTSTNGEGTSNGVTYGNAHGLRIVSSSTASTEKSIGVTSPASPSVISYEKKDKDFIY